MLPGGGGDKDIVARAVDATEFLDEAVARDTRSMFENAQAHSKKKSKKARR